MSWLSNRQKELFSKIFDTEDLLPKNKKNGLKLRSLSFFTTDTKSIKQMVPYILQIEREEILGYPQYYNALKNAGLIDNDNKINYFGKLFLEFIHKNDDEANKAIQDQTSIKNIEEKYIIPLELIILLAVYFKSLTEDKTVSIEVIDNLKYLKLNILDTMKEYEQKKFDVKNFFKLDDDDLFLVIQGINYQGFEIKKLLHLKDEILNFKEEYIRAYNSCPNAGEYNNLDIIEKSYYNQINYFKTQFQKDIRIRVRMTFLLSILLEGVIFPISISKIFFKKEEQEEIIKKYELENIIESYKKLSKNIEKNYKLQIKDYQKIVYGAPGTGKSYSLNEEVENIFGANKERVTFYDGYTHGQFIGMYKPTMTEEGDISYKYVPGSFMKQLVKAYINSENKFCLIIEEINRAKADKIFGNIFQLLDRNEEGNSRYPISTSEEQLQYLREKLKDNKDILERIENEGLYLPNNLYIWATMNSADDGVQPLDTAFKRRWKFNYISLNANEDNFGNDGETFIIDKYKENNILWNNFRTALNDTLKVNITEDRLIAPFFISPNDFEEIDTNIKKIDKNILSEKVLMYIFDDLLRHYPKLRKEIFHNDVKTFSDIHEKVTKNNNFLELIFNEGFLNQILGSDGIDGKK